MPSRRRCPLHPCPWTKPSRSSGTCASAFRSTTSISTKPTNGPVAWSPACRNGRWSCKSLCRIRPWHWPIHWQAVRRRWASAHCPRRPVCWSMRWSMCSYRRAALPKTRKPSWMRQKISAVCCTNSLQASSRRHKPRYSTLCAAFSKPKWSAPSRRRWKMPSRPWKPGASKTPKPCWRKMPQWPKSQCPKPQPPCWRKALPQCHRRWPMRPWHRLCRCWYLQHRPLHLHRSLLVRHWTSTTTSTRWT